MGTGACVGAFVDAPHVAVWRCWSADAHVTQLVPSNRWPTAHATQLVFVAWAYIPAAQSRHADIPSCGACAFPVQSSGCTPPTQYFPLGHACVVIRGVTLLST